MEISLVIMMSEASCVLRNSAEDLRTKQIMKRELGSEIVSNILIFVLIQSISAVVNPLHQKYAIDGRGLPAPP